MRWPLYGVVVAERSMEPALRPGDWLLAWRGLRSGTAVNIRPGQIVVARHPRDPAMFLVKRVAWREAAGWWLASDNASAGAVDSARFGAVSPELIEARVVARYRRGRRGQCTRTGPAPRLGTGPGGGRAK